MCPCLSPAPKRRLRSIFSFSERDRLRGVVDRHVATLTGAVIEISKAKVVVFVVLLQLFLCKYVKGCKSQFIVNFEPSSQIFPSSDVFVTESIALLVNIRKSSCHAIVKRSLKISYSISIIRSVGAVFKFQLINKILHVSPHIKSLDIGELL